MYHGIKLNSIAIRSVPDAIAHALADSIHTENGQKAIEIQDVKKEKEIEINIAEENINHNKSKCVDCGEMSLIYAEGCSKCLSCSYSSCG